MPALIVKHPAYEVKLHDPRTVSDPREQAVLLPDDAPSDRAVIRAQAATIAELQQAVKVLTRTPHHEDELLDATEVLERLASRIGWRRVSIIARNLAHINGESI